MATVNVLLYPVDTIAKILKQFLQSIDLIHADCIISILRKSISSCCQAATYLTVCLRSQLLVRGDAVARVLGSI